MDSRRHGVLKWRWLWVVLAYWLGGCSDQQAEQYPPQDVFPEMRAFYENHRNIPPEIQRTLASGTLSETAFEAQKHRYPKFFKQASLADLPTHLRWENGQDLPEIGSPNARKGGVLRSFLQDYPRTFRRVGPDSNGSFRPFIVDWTTMGLAQRHPNDTETTASGFKYFPGIAEAWALDQASHTVYVRLHPQARWSDGEAITTDDILFLFFFYNSPYIKAPWYKNYYNETYAQLTRFDDHTFAIQTRTAAPDFAGRVLGLEPLPEHFFKALGSDFVSRYQWRFVPTSGPYVLKDQDARKGRSIALTRIKDWWAKDLKFWRYRFNFDRIQLSIIRDVPKAFEAFRKGDIDRFGLTLPEYWFDKLPDDDPLVQSGYIEKKVFYNDKPRPTYGLWINSAQPLLDSQPIRLGIQHATHWALVIDKYFRGDYARLQTSSDGYGAFTAPDVRARTFNIEQALGHFRRAGFQQRGADGILVNDRGQRLSFTLTTGYQTLENTLLILREEAMRAGLEFRVEVLDGTAAWKKTQEKKHDIAFSAFGVSAEMYPRFWETNHSVNAYDQAFLADGSMNPARKPKTQTNNLTAIALSELDQQIEAYRASTDLTEIRALAHKMEKMIHDYGAFSPGFSIPFFRLGHWRWIRFPSDFSVKLAGSASEYFLAWIDEDIKAETEAARAGGKTWPAVIAVYDQYCRKEVCGP